MYIDESCWAGGEVRPTIFKVASCYAIRAPRVLRIASSVVTGEG